MTTSKPTVRGKQVLALEAEALKNLSDNLPKSFDAICEAIINCKGRIIVSGLGKAGLIGQKFPLRFQVPGLQVFFYTPARLYMGTWGDSGLQMLSSSYQIVAQRRKSYD